MSASDRYVVNVYDCAGQFRETKCAERARYRGKVVRVENLDRVDLGCADGLTEDERDALEAT